MSDLKPLIFSVYVFLLLGLVFPYFLSFFVPLGSLPVNSLSNATIDFIEGDGFTILSVVPFVEWDDVTVNPFDYIPESFRDKIVEAFIYIGVLPEFMIYFILILTLVMMVLTVIKLLPAT